MARDIKQLHPRLQEIIPKLQEEGKKQGLIIGISECFRSVAEQDDLYAQGRTKPGNIVTKAKGSTYSSQHQWGIAFDVYRNDGTGAYNEKDKWFEKVGAIGEKLGLGWGGNWKSMVDKPHFYLPDWGSDTSQLKSKYGTFENFKKSWGSSTSTTTATPPTTAVKSSYSANVKDWQLALNKDYFFDSNGKKLVEDGYWGTNTEFATSKVMLSTKTNGQYLNVTRWVQKKLKVTVDGYFGPNTAAKAIDYQKSNGLAVDGIVGLKTIKKMLGI